MPTPEQEIASRCLVVRLRMIQRVVTQIYEDELRGYGIKASQCNVLVAIAQASSIRSTELGRRLYLEASTLSRNLERLERRGWIVRETDPDDARSRWLTITPAGRKLLAELLPGWRAAQKKAKRLLGSEMVTAIGDVAGELWSRAEVS